MEILGLSLGKLFMTAFPPLNIPETLLAGPGPGNTDKRVLAAYAQAGVADHMQSDVIRGMKEIKVMLRELWGTNNTYTYGIAGTGWNGLDSLQSAILPGDKVVAFNNGTFSGIDCQTICMKASMPNDLEANPTMPHPKNVHIIDVPHGKSVDEKTIEEALSLHKPMWAFMSHWETGSGRINDLEGFNRVCKKRGVLGLIDAVSSLGIDNFAIDDYTGVVGWASCPQKGVLGLPLTYAPVSFRNNYIDIVKKRGCYNYVHHPILAARHWSIIDGKDVEVPAYHQTHSCYAIASFHEALRLSLAHGKVRKAQDYKVYEQILRNALIAMGCIVTSNMTSLVVFNLPEELSGREKELVQKCRSENFGIWTTLSDPAQIRIGILNQLSQQAIEEIISRFADAMMEFGCNNFEKRDILTITRSEFS